MIEFARKNTPAYGRLDATYVLGRAETIPFQEASFDGVISANSLHEWIEPGLVFQAVQRVLKPGGRFMIMDLRRDMSNSVKQFLLKEIVPAQLHSHFLNSVEASYTPAELNHLIRHTPLAQGLVKGHPVGLTLTGICN
jgi:ubiquinone/menaquinone biosynthesis C-methylase UbiE